MQELSTATSPPEPPCGVSTHPADRHAVDLQATAANEVELLDVQPNFEGYQILERYVNV